MSDFQQGPSGASGYLEPGRNNVQLVYALYLAGFIIGITPFFGIVLAYINRGKAGGWVESHYTYAIRTFWIGILYTLISLVLMFIIIGVLGFIATTIWMIARCVIGLQKANRNEPIANPQSWLI
jgi:uncharacterized membrane protein